MTGERRKIKLRALGSMQINLTVTSTQSCAEIL
jgi:hypothetical protein